MKDCPHLSDSDRQFIFNLYDKALKNRVVDVSERDHEITERAIALVEEYYDLREDVSANVCDVGDNDHNPEMLADHILNEGMANHNT